MSFALYRGRFIKRYNPRHEKVLILRTRKQDDATFCCECGNPEFVAPHPAPARAILEATAPEIPATTAPV